MRVPFAIYVFISLALSPEMYAQDTTRFSMQDILLSINRNYPQLQYYEAKISSIRSMMEGAKAWMPPTLGIALDRWPYRLSMLKEQSADNQAGVMVTVQQMIPNPAKLNAKRDYIASLESVQRNELEWQRNVLHFSARIYYFHRYIAEQKLKLIDEYRNLLNTLIKTAKDKYAYNQTDLGTIYKAEASLSELENMAVMFHAQIAESNIGLNTLMNRDINAPFRIDTLIEPAGYSAQYYGPGDSTAMIRNDILSMQSQIKSMELNKRLAASGARPDFGIQVSHGQMFGMGNQFSIMGMMTMPIFSWSSKMYKSEVSSMTYEIEAMEKQKSAMTLMARQMIGEKSAMLMYAHRELENYDMKVLPAYRKNLESNILSYKQNTGNFFTLLDSWNMLLMKELERSDKLGSVLNTQAELEFQREVK